MIWRGGLACAVGTAIGLVTGAGIAGLKPRPREKRLRRMAVRDSSPGHRKRPYPKRAITRETKRALLGRTQRGGETACRRQILWRDQSDRSRKSEGQGRASFDRHRVEG
uniref:Putative secreted protein n=1 Tax=Ixodes ricinus TaxID=34613 RepID=A0A6B0UAB2_IXORI